MTPVGVFSAMPLATPYYLIDETLLEANLAKVDRLRALSGAKCVMALKAFATWSTFAQIAPHMDGSTSSSLNEVRLGREKFGGETHAYSVAWSDAEIDEAISYADKIIFNSIGQFERYAAKARHLPIGIRVNPGISHSHFDLADPARPYSRLGERDLARIESVMDRASGFMIHCNCENDSFESFSTLLGRFEEKLGSFFERIDWVSFGGGIHFTGENYPVDKLAERLKAFAERYRLQVYLEPGDAIVTQTTTLEVSVLDIVENEKQIAIVDSAVEAHMLDLLVYRETATIAPDTGPHRYVIAGKSCLAGDVFGEFSFETPLLVGDRVSLLNAGGYTMVKKNWFNGVSMPSIAIRRKDGTVDLIRKFDYADYVASLS